MTRIKPSPRQRLDQMLLDRGLVETRAKAQALILAGEVTVNGQRADKPGHAVPTDSRIEVAQPLRYVGRGGFKLEAALDHWSIDVTGRTCADIGASTGGFTDCLLQRGAATVYAVDVGAGQIDWKLRSDARVVLREGVNARYLSAEHIPEAIDFACADVSFISVTLILPALVPLLKPAGSMVILVKPQFEVGKGQVGKGGIVRDPVLHAGACARVERVARELGFETAIIESPVLGAEGNKEFLLHARR
ncbi:MAG TPA: TlyA family RNA methyltransferase [Bryobacteraceae bacterium]|nr:TlyA family RNA methyltransferase [Bryobacteraceae bacterium]